MDPTAPSATPPGWYPDHTGVLRWWDGLAWGPPAPAPPPPAPNKALAIISHLGPIFGGFILPLVIYLVCDKNDQYVRHHASEGLNFSLTLLIAQLVAFLLFFMGFAGLASGSSGMIGTGVGLFALAWVALFGLGVVGWIFAIIGAVQASGGNWYRYPICIRFVKGAAPKGTPRIHLR
jgi:uncharacterized Tic20 family protein